MACIVQNESSSDTFEEFYQVSLSFELLVC